MSNIKAAINTVVVRKRDGARGIIVKRELAVPSVAHPGIYGKTIVTVRLFDADKRAAAGGDMVGDLGWLRSSFKSI